MSDKNHAWMMNKVIDYYEKLKTNKFECEIDPEVYYNDYGLKGYVDLIIKTSDIVDLGKDLGKCRRNLIHWIIEIKSEPDDVGNIIRQLNTPIKVWGLNNSKKLLILPANKKCVDFVKENIPVFKTAKIQIRFLSKSGLGPIIVDYNIFEEEWCDEYFNNYLNSDNEVVFS